MRRYATDTHTLLWYFAAPERLGNGAAVAFNDVNEGKALLFISVIVLAELFLVLEKHRYPLNFDAVLKELQASSNVSLVEISLENILACRALTAIPDLHDRIIVAEAMAQNASLITFDQAITSAGVIPIIW